MFAKMISMARTPAEAKKEVEKYDMPATASPVASVPTFPYGLCISLEDETLDKLGMEGAMPAVGDVIQFTAMAKVTSASDSEREKSDGSKEQCRRVELQITDMGVPGDAAGQQLQKSEARRKRFYGEMAAEPDGDE
jgi:hypothetical protein